MPRIATQRRDDLDRAKGLAIILVVFGHLVAREGPVGVGWYEPLRQAIYLFHMPFFLFLSGYAARLSGATEARDWADLVRRRAARLLVPFAAFGLLILGGKLALGGVLAVDNLPASPWAGLRALIWDTGKSPATSVWYLLALFVFSVATPPLRRLGGAWALLGVAAALYALPVPPLVYLDRVCGYFLFFVVGVLAADRTGDWDAAVDRQRWLALAAFGTILGLAWTGVLAGSGLPGKASMLVAGLAGMPALHGLCRAWASTVLLWFGQRAFPIYLLNTICIGLAKAALVPALGWDAAHFPVIAAALMAAGLFGPLVLSAMAGVIAARAGGWFPTRPVSAGSR
jgi:fucose 4-O-acetylase-like acetyltransferase